MLPAHGGKESGTTGVISAKILQRLDSGSLQWLGRPFWVLSIAFATVGVFWLPWYFPATTPSMSESYSLGFNNRLATLSLAFAIGFATVARLVGRTSARPIGWLCKRPNLLPPWRSARSEYLVLITFTFIWTQIIWAWCARLVDPAYGDARGIIFAIDLIALGKVPYRDFIFNYGPALPYLPYFLSSWSQGAVSFEQAHLAVLVFLTGAGFVAIFVILRALRLPAAFRPVVLAVALLSWALFTTCMAQIAMRFVCVPLSLVALHAITNRVRGQGVARVASIGATSFLTAASCMALSPEMGIAAAVAQSAYAITEYVLRRQADVAGAVLTGTAAAFLAALSLFPGCFETVFAFTSGFFNLPIYLNPHNVITVSAAVAVLPALIASALKNPSDDRTPLAIGLAVVAGLLLVGAFGRAAPVHVFYNGFTLMLLTFAMMASLGTTWLRRWTWVYAVVNILLLQISWWWVNTGTCATALQLQRFYRDNPQVVHAWQEKWESRRLRHPSGKALHWSSVLPYPDELDAIADRGQIIQTGGSEWNLWLGRYLLLQTEFPQDYFTPWLLFATTPAQIERRVDELSKARYLLMPESDFASAHGQIDVQAYERSLDRWLSTTMFYPVRSRVRFGPFFSETEIAKRLTSRFRPQGRFQFFVYTPFILLENDRPQSSGTAAESASESL